MAQTKKQQEEVKQAMAQEPPRNYSRDAYPNVAVAGLISLMVQLNP